MDTLTFLANHLPAVAPEIGLMILAMAVLLIDSYLPDARKNIAYVAAIGMAAIAVTPLIWSPAATATVCTTDCWGGMVHHDGMAQIFKVMIVLAGAVTSLMAVRDSTIGEQGEFYLIIIIATLGGCLLASSADLVMLFVALETVTIPLYILAAFRTRDERSSESGMKYFLFGSFASAILLYGFSFLFGFAGTTDLQGIAEALRTTELSLVAVLGVMTFIIVGFGFKISAAPFHFWTPDVYEGAPTPVTAFISVASKAASFAVLMRFFIYVFPESVVIADQSVEIFWVNLIGLIAVISMTLGNVLALRQENIKRMLAYSSIAQAGYAMIGIAALQGDATYAVSSVAFYMFMYVFSNLVVFAGVILIAEDAGTEQIREYAGIQRRAPWLAVAMTVGLLSLAGIPPAAGFFGKFFLFQAAVEANLVGLAIIGVLNSIIALYYYLVVIKIMWVDPGKNEDVQLEISPAMGWVFGITTIVVLLLGVVPGVIIDWAREGAAALAQILLIAV